jgi:hypothetical protein
MASNVNPEMVTFISGPNVGTAWAEMVFFPNRLIINVNKIPILFNINVY